MGCDNLATKADIQELSSQIKASENRIINEIQGVGKAISILISQGITTIIGKCQEILNAVLGLKGDLESIKSQVLVIVSIVNNILSVVTNLQAIIIAGLASISGQLGIILGIVNSILSQVVQLFSAIQQINALLSEVNSNVVSLRSLVQEDISISSSTLSLATNIKSDTTQIITTVRTISDTQIVLTTNLNPVINSPLFRIGGGGGGAFIDILSPTINNILALCIAINNAVKDGEGTGDEIKKLTKDKIKLKQTDCINCEEAKKTSKPCTTLEQSTGARVTEKEVEGVNSALIEIDSKLSTILANDCAPKNKIQKFVQVIVDGLPRKGKVYFGQNDSETVVFAGWVKFKAFYQDSNGGEKELDIGLEQPIRRLEEFFLIPDYCSSYSVQPINESTLRHRIVLVQNNKIISDTLSPLG